MARGFVNGRRVFRLRGESTEEKLAHLEKVMTRMMGRSAPAIYGFIPPVMVSGYVDEPQDWGIAKFLIPAQGTIIKVCLAVTSYDSKEPANFIIRAANAKGAYKTSFKTRKPVLIEEVEIKVEAGDTVVFEVEKNKEGKFPVHGIWYSILYEISIDMRRKQEFLISKIEELEDEGIQLSLAE